MRCPLVGRLGRVSLPPWARRPGACRAVASAELARSVTLICRTDLGLRTANKGDAMGPSAVRSQMPASEPGLGAARTANRPCHPASTDIRHPRPSAGCRDDRLLLASLGIDLDAVRARVDAAFGPDA